jgi:acetoin utilization protein AcuB
MLVRYRMSPKVVVTEPQESLAKARQLLQRHRIRQLPVMRGEQVVGIITDRDLRSARAKAQIVKDAMTSKPFTIGPDVPVDEAAQVLCEHKINALPVIDRKKLVGILTATDVLNAFVDLSGVAESTYRIVVRGKNAKRSESIVRGILERARAEIKWMQRDQQKPSVIHVRLNSQRIDDIVTALEAAGLEVGAVVAPPRRRL